MSKNSIQITAAMKAEVLRELRDSARDLEDAEEAYYKALAAKDTMVEVSHCDHSLEIIKVGSGRMLSCRKCPFFWEYPHED